VRPPLLLNFALATAVLFAKYLAAAAGTPLAAPPMPAVANIEVTLLLKQEPQPSDQ
jgi:hypothetical protein